MAITAVLTLAGCLPLQRRTGFISSLSEMNTVKKNAGKAGLGAGQKDAQLLDLAKNADIIIKKAKSIKELKAAANLHDAVAIFFCKIGRPANRLGERRR